MNIALHSGSLLERFDGNEVLTSSELIQRLCGSDCSEENARQIIRRRARADGIWRSSDLKLRCNERLFAPATFLKQPGFIAAVASKLDGADRKGFARCLAVLAERHALNKVDVMRLLAVAPDAAGVTSRRMRMYEHELSGMRELGVEVVHAGTTLESIVFPDGHTNTTKAVADAAQGLRKGAVLARVLIDRMRKENVVAWNQVEVPEPSTPFCIFNGQVFTASGFSYLSPMVYRKGLAKGPTPCPVVIDCYYDRCTVAQVSSFLQRIERATCRGSKRHACLGLKQASCLSASLVVSSCQITARRSLPPLRRCG